MDNRKMPTIEELQEMAAVDIRNVDKSTLVDLDDVEILQSFRWKKELLIISDR